MQGTETLSLPLVTRNFGANVWESQKRKQSPLKLVLREHTGGALFRVHSSAMKPLAAAAAPRLGPLVLPSTRDLLCLLF